MFAGMIGFGVQALYKLLLRQLVSVRRNVIYRGIWMLTLSALAIAIVSRVVSNDQGGTICAAIMFPTVTCVFVVVGYFIDKKFNQAIQSVGRQKNDRHA